jgi:deoxycytidylate deaminase
MMDGFFMTTWGENGAMILEKKRIISLEWNDHRREGFMVLESKSENMTHSIRRKEDFDFLADQLGFKVPDNTQESFL